MVDGVTGRLPSSTAVTGLRNRVLNGSPDLAHTQAAPLEAVVHRRAHGAVRQRRGRIVCARPCCSRCCLPARPASPARHDGRVRTAQPAPRTPSMRYLPHPSRLPRPARSIRVRYSAVRQRICASACASASARYRSGAPSFIGSRRCAGASPSAACGADRGPAGVRSAVSHRHDGELDYHSDTAPNPGRQVRPALGFAAPAWALSVGTDGLGHTISTLPREAC